MVSLGLLGLLLRGGLLVGLAAFIEASRLSERPSFGAALQPLAGGLFVALIAGALVELFIDYARVRSVARPTEKLGVVLAEAARLLRRRPATSALLTLVGALGFALPTAFYHLLAAGHLARSASAFTLLCIGRLVTTLLRATVAMTVLAATVELTATE
jgi:hypothetical protein